MAITVIGVRQLRQDLAEVLEGLQTGRLDFVLVTRHSRPLVALLPPDADIDFWQGGPRERREDELAAVSTFKLRSTLASCIQQVRAGEKPGLLIVRNDAYAALMIVPTFVESWLRQKYPHALAEALLRRDGRPVPLHPPGGQQTAFSFLQPAR
jgi:antitoxin (DNA-binding transcriptional repressor) of toxin-antitoxin stability system